MQTTKKKILILGDSFADPNDGNITPDFVCYYHELAKNYNITNFGLASSNLPHSYRLYQIHKADYDKVIVMVTAPGRIKLPEIGKLLLNEVNDYHRKTEFLPNLWTVQGLKKQNQFNTTSAQKILSAAEDYFIYLSNEEDNMLCQDLMLEKMKDENTLLIPCFKESWASVERNLFEMSYIELTKNNQKKVFPDNRPNHFNQSNHKLLAVTLSEWIETGKFSWDQLYKTSK